MTLIDIRSWLIGLLTNQQFVIDWSAIDMRYICLGNYLFVVVSINILFLVVQCYRKIYMLISTMWFSINKLTGTNYDFLFILDGYYLFIVLSINSLILVK